MDTSDDHVDDTQGADGHCSIQADLVGALEVSTWSARSAASTNDVDTDERRQTMARRGLALERHHCERPLVVNSRVRLHTWPGTAFRSAAMLTLTTARITIYRRTICAVLTSDSEVAGQVRRTVIHEVGHHFGIDRRRAAARTRMVSQQATSAINDHVWWTHPRLSAACPGGRGAAAVATVSSDFGNRADTPGALTISDRRASRLPSQRHCFP